MNNRISWDRRKFETMLHDNKYVLIRQHGSHRVWYKNGRHISVPLILNQMVAQRLIKENNLTVEE